MVEKRKAKATVQVVMPGYIQAQTVPFTRVCIHGKVSSGLSTSLTDPGNFQAIKLGGL